MIDTAIIVYGTRTTITFEYGDPVQNGSDGRVVIDIGPVSDAMPTGYRLRECTQVRKEPTSRRSQVQLRRRLY